LICIDELSYSHHQLASPERGIFQSTGDFNRHKQLFDALRAQHVDQLDVQKLFELSK
jgi:hypothetical protein